jgi:hypothetical protein
MKILFHFYSFLLMFASFQTGFSQDLLWGRQIGGLNNELTYSITTDLAGNSYTAGSFQGTVDFDPGTGIYNLTSAVTGIFILKLDPSGNFIWVKQMGGTGYAEPYCIALDRNGNIYTTGYFSDTIDFDPGTAFFNLNPTNSWGDAFISKLDPNGNFLWAEAISGNIEDIGFALTTDDSMYVYATGYFQGTADLNPGQAVSNYTALGYEDIYILKLDSSGSLVWAKQLGGSDATSEEAAYDIEVDDSGNVYTVGEHGVFCDLDPGPGNYYLNTSGAFVSKLNSAGDFVWAQNFATQGGYVKNYSSALDNSGNLYVTGIFTDTLFGFVNSWNPDGFFVKMNADGNMVWARQLAGSNWVNGMSLTADDSGYIYTKGSFTGTVDLDPGIGVLNLTANGQEDHYLAKFDSAGVLVWGGQYEGSSGPNAYLNNGNSIALDPSGNIYTTGSFSETGDFDPGIGIFTISSNGYWDASILKISAEPSSVPETSDRSFLSVFPNPTNDIVNIILKKEAKGTMEIYDALGSKIFETTFDRKEIRVDLGNLSQGIYLIRITIADVSSSRPIIHN